MPATATASDYMIETVKKLEEVIIGKNGFTGFDPITEAQATRYGVDKDDYQLATYEVVTIVTDTDDDAGNGQPVEYTRASISKRVVVAKNEVVSPFVTKILTDNQPVQGTFEVRSGAVIIDELAVEA